MPSQDSWTVIGLAAGPIASVTLWLTHVLTVRKLQLEIRQLRDKETDRQKQGLIVQATAAEIERYSPGRRTKSFFFVAVGFFAMTAIAFEMARREMRDQRASIADLGRALQQMTDESTRYRGEATRLAAFVPLQTAFVSFHTLDDDKDPDTRVDVSIIGRDGQLLASANGITGLFGDNSDNGPFAVALNRPVTRDELRQARVRIGITSAGNDTWKFGCRLDFRYSDGNSTTSTVPPQQLDGAKRTVEYPL